MDGGNGKAYFAQMDGDVLKWCKRPACLTNGIPTVLQPNVLTFGRATSVPEWEYLIATIPLDLLSGTNKGLDVADERELIKLMNLALCQYNQ